MSNLRHDLLTSGWSMMEASKWVKRIGIELDHESFRINGYKTKKTKTVSAYPGTPFYPPKTQFVHYGVMEATPPSIKSYADEMSWLLHEALPEETFHLDCIESRKIPGSSHYWHTDGGYLRVLLTYEGEGTIAALSYENNVPTPFGYALILTGEQRHWATGIQETWHTSPLTNKNRRMVLVTFRGV